MKLKVFLQTRPAESWETIDVVDGFRYTIFTSKDVAYLGWAFVSEAEVEFDLPEGYDPRVGAIQVLKDRKAQLLAETQEKVMQIDEQINKMSALSYVERV